MYEIKALNFSETTDATFKSLYELNASAANKKRKQSHDKSFEEYKANLNRLFQTASIRFELYLFLNDDVVEGYVDRHAINVETSNELQMLQFKSWKALDDVWNDYNLPNLLRQWLPDYLETKVEVLNSKELHLFSQLGFTASNEKIFLDLERDSVNWNYINQKLSSDVEKTNGIKFNLIENYTDEIYEELAFVFTTLLNDMQRVDMEHTYLIQANELKEGDEKRKSIGIIARRYGLWNSSNELFGMSILVHKAKSPTKIYQYMTGVLQPYRKQGLSSWMKANIYNDVLKSYPSVEKITTDCYTVNEGILDLNYKLGFQDNYSVTEMFYSRP